MGLGLGATDYVTGVAGFVLWFGLLSFLSATLSGWFILGRRFRFSGQFDGAKWRFRSGRMRFYTRYGTCLTVGANALGLYLAVFPILRIGHPPLFIPWSEVAVMAGTKGIIYHLVELRLGRAEQIPLRLNFRTVEKLKQAAGAAWPMETAAV